MSTQRIVAPRVQMTGQKYGDQYVFRNVRTFLTAWRVKYGANIAKYLIQYYVHENCVKQIY